MKGVGFMYRIAPYRRSNSLTGRDVFDLFDEFFNDRPLTYVRDFRVDVKEEKDRYIVEAELPGFDKKDLSIKFENDYLTITINKEQDTEEKRDNDKFLHKERFVFRSERSIYLEDVDPNKITASMENGILKVELQKLEHKVNTYMIDIK